jgi:MYXO-CTERM domain-containing protein
MFASALIGPLLLLGTFEPTVHAQLQAAEGHASLQAGVLSHPLPSPLSDAVHRFALDRADALGLPAFATLGAPRPFGTRFGASFHMAQQVDGIEVDAARVVVTVDRFRRVSLVASSAVPYARVARRWNLSAEQALAKVSAQVPLAMRDSSGRPYGGTLQRFFPIGDELRAGYLVWVPTLDIRDNWYLAVDAEDGDIHWSQNRVFTANDADVYAYSPGGLDAGIGVTAVTRVLLERFSPSQQGGFLQGDQVTAWNCCPNEACSTATGAKSRRVQGTTTFNGMPVNYDVAICDRLQRGTNDPATNPNQDYVYAPVDAPGGATLATQGSPTDSDPFAEVHAFWHVNQVYDFVRALSIAAQPLFPGETIPPFQMRDALQGKAPAIWVNVVMPDQNEMFSSYISSGGVLAKANNLLRVNNAAFMARENFQSLVIPELALDVDAILMFQGTHADFAYDGPVVWHEFGHGVIHSTAKFQSFTVDARSGNNEGGALHEGIADYIAAAFGQRSLVGDYVGPRLPGAGEGALRDVDNQEKCPDVLWGEVHQDSKHFTGALWEARRELFSGSDQGRTFDAAIYAALVSMTPKTDFQGAAATIVAHVKGAFPGMANAETAMQAIFNSRGVTQCSKVLDATSNPGPRNYFGIGGTQAAGLGNGQVVPGPYQFAIQVPEGARSLTVNANISGGGLFGGGQVVSRLLARNGEPVTFTRSGAQLSNDADVTAAFTGSGGAYTATVELDVPCGSKLYFALGTPSAGGETLRNVSWTFQKAHSCPGPPDAGAGSPVDAGPDVEALPSIAGGGTQSGGEAAAVGCGCGTTEPVTFALGLLALAGFALLRRRRLG